MNRIYCIFVFVVSLSSLLPAQMLDMRPNPRTGRPRSGIVFGKAQGWSDMLRFENTLLSERNSRWPAIQLDSGSTANFLALDAFVDFEEPLSSRFTDHLGQYHISVADNVLASAFSQRGEGAALFQLADGAGGISLDPLPGALLYGTSLPQDFSIEFWLYPTGLADDERFLFWSASAPENTAIQGEKAGKKGQKILCKVLRNQFQWDFTHFFISPESGEGLDIRLLSSSRVMPGKWSHHLLRYDSQTGFLEYLIDGALEDATHTTKTGREGGAIFVPRPGRNGRMELGGRYAGLMDNFAIHRERLEAVSLTRSSSHAGRVESRWFDLKSDGALLEQVDVDIRSPGLSGYRVLVRMVHSPWRSDIESVPWRAVEVGKNLGDRYRARWLQVAVELYPGESKDPSPILEELSLIISLDNPPPPPPKIFARPHDGAVELEWQASPGQDTKGYMVYFGSDKGEYFGLSNTGLASPLDVRGQNKIIIDGLENGRLYWFTVAAYDSLQSEIGPYAREIAARPLRMDNEFKTFN